MLANNGEKTVLILAGTLNSGLSYLITTVSNLILVQEKNAHSKWSLREVARSEKKRGGFFLSFIHLENYCRQTFFFCLSNFR